MFKVYDNGGETLDRYTIVMNDTVKDHDLVEWVQYIGCNTPSSFWQHGEMRKSEFSTRDDKQIRVLDLPEETQQHLLYELDDFEG